MNRMLISIFFANIFLSSTVFADAALVKNPIDSLRLRHSEDRDPLSARLYSCGIAGTYGGSTKIDLDNKVVCVNGGNPENVGFCTTFNAQVLPIIKTTKGVAHFDQGEYAFLAIHAEAREGTFDAKIYAPAFPECRPGNHCIHHADLNTTLWGPSVTTQDPSRPIADMDGVCAELAKPKVAEPLPPYNHPFSPLTPPTYRTRGEAKKVIAAFTAAGLVAEGSNQVALYDVSSLICDIPAGGDASTAQLAHCTMLAGSNKQNLAVTGTVADRLITVVGGHPTYKADRWYYTMRALHCEASAKDEASCHFQY